MKRILVTMLSIFSSSALADCGDERLSYMVSNTTTSAKALIACLEVELAQAKQTATVSGGTAGNNCPTIPIIPLGPSSPGSPVGSEKQIYAFMNYYRNLTELDAQDWMVGAASALGEDEAAVLVTGAATAQVCANGLTTYDFDWDAGQFFEAKNELGILIYPEFKATVGDQ